MDLSRINFIKVSRASMVSSIIIFLANEFYFNNDILYYASIFLAIFAIALVLIFFYLFRTGRIDLPIKILIETDVDQALADGVITEEQAKGMAKTIVLDGNEVFLNLVFNIAILNHFDLVPIEVIRDALPQVPPPLLSKLYMESREISDDLNDYFRSQRFLNKADVILRSEEIKYYLRTTYPWMDEFTLNNTYDYFFLGIGNG